MEKQIILLNGSSSSGKSTLAKALKSLIYNESNKIYEVVSIDDFLKMSLNETIYEDDVFEISNDLCKKVLESLESSDGVIIDHVITSERIFKQLKENLYSYPVLTVHITCPLNILKRRELERGDRCLGSAESSNEYLYPKDGYDLTVDTGEKTPSENALLIYDELSNL
ncbi:chloramphenicol 3-O phosphotransferase [Eubacterium uniforme]|uniref:Chloramphenicol 3-O phosphotransferase n=1 Tax=Eubacterium uniforme TaxID=39495 RepID=A0A1T4W5F1_9FIRM|nr:AAA family ATPase [Eubacterium uniforme]SKA72278.1 chloramphenicol 3-O phosphotransferase [Eubacterium uniforme]